MRLATTPDQTIRMTTSLVFAGAALNLAMGAAHGDLPENSGEAALAFVVAHPAYALIHFGSVVGATLWALGLGGYPRLLNDPRARVVGGWAANAALIGAAVLAVQFSLDGFGLPAMANRFVAADPATRAALGDIAMMSADVMIGLALLWVILLYGLTIVLVATSALLERRQPRLLSWSGVIIGVWTGTGALAVALGAEVIPDWLAFVSAIVGGNLWLMIWAASARSRVKLAD